MLFNYKKGILIMENKRNMYCSQAQKNALIELLNNPSYEILKSGKFSSTFTYKDGQKKWMEIGEALNAIPGSKKDWRQWRKTWQDIRTKTKMKKSRNVKYSSGTGGGPSAPPLTEMDEKVLTLMTTTEILGASGVTETPINFEMTQDSIGTNDENEITALEIPEIEKSVVYEHVTDDEHNNNDHSYSIKMYEDCHTGNLVNKPRIQKNINKSQKLKDSAIAANKLVNIASEKLDFKKDYYEKKLVLLERQVEALENIALGVHCKQV